jgi:hypothetical protein
MSSQSLSTGELAEAAQVGGFMKAFYQHVSVIRHEAVRENFKPSQPRRSPKLRQCVSYRCCIGKEASTPERAKREEIAMAAPVAEAWNPWRA